MENCSQEKGVKNFFLCPLISLFYKKRGQDQIIKDAASLEYQKGTFFYSSWDDEKRYNDIVCALLPCDKHHTRPV